MRSHNLATYVVTYESDTFPVTSNGLDIDPAVRAQ
jgi:hypothetical protein